MKIHFLFSCLVVLFSRNALSQNSAFLKKRNISHLEILINQGSIINPGNTIEMEIIAFSEHGDELSTTGCQGANIKWNNYKVSIDKGKFTNGKINEDLDIRRDSIITINVQAKYNKALKAIKTVALNRLVKLELYTSPLAELAPGNSLKIDVASTYDNGKTSDSYYNNNTFDKFKNFDIRVISGEYKYGKILIHSDLKKINKHRVTICISSKLYPEVRDTLSLKLDYVKNYSLSVSSRSGFDGFSGRSGFFALTCLNGESGQHGTNGDQGEIGPTLSVFIDSYYDSILFHAIVKVNVKNVNTREVWNYLINPFGGKLRITSTGGAGGDGGKGGDGGNGAKGEDGVKTIKREKINDSTYVEKEEFGPGHCGGRGGDGGNGGYGGNGGDGGDIIIKYTTAAKKYIDIIKPESLGGRRGWGGIGAFGGLGGSGGSGNPSGSTGPSGCRGRNGEDGYYGRQGEIIFEEIRGLSEN